MKVIRGSVDEIFQSAYKNFSKNCNSTSISMPEIKENYREVRDLFVKSGQVQQFYDKTLELSKQIDSCGNSNICTLLLNELSKFCMSFKLRETPESILERTIVRFRENNDSLHELARIVDLEEVCQQVEIGADYLERCNRKKIVVKRFLPIMKKVQKTS